MPARWEAIDALMRDFLSSAGVEPADLVGVVSDQSMRAWFGFEDINNHGSVVYFVRCPGKDMVKIGYTRHLRQRLQHIQHYSIDKVEFAACIPGTRATERALHARFHKARVVGEWFSTSDELEAVISQASHMYPQPADLMVLSTT